MQCLQQVYTLTTQLQTVITAYNEPFYADNVLYTMHYDYGKPYNKHTWMFFVRNSNIQNITRDIHNLIPNYKVRKALAIESNKFYQLFKYSSNNPIPQEYILYEYDLNYKIINVNYNIAWHLRYSIDTKAPHFKTLLSYFGYDVSHNDYYHFNQTGQDPNKGIVYDTVCQFRLKNKEDIVMYNYMHMGIHRDGSTLWMYHPDTQIGWPFQFND